jgi:hypothetical protein
MKELLTTARRARPQLYLAGMAGVMIDTMLTRFDRHQSLLNWSTFKGMVFGTFFVFLVHCVWISLWYRQTPDGPAVDSN